ncbi:hypothetical protein [Streptomyces roseolus]|uniref:hypothetical protein n=1 Tax=Streptomyces roseolus TaxID=67358 RepID=UPI001674F05B|nr:hypothetical protein [Streptomyces roseolus]GGR31317.1 hypothetical protein GCM10010282_24770 [Streptomyces roseolus]
MKLRLTARALPLVPAAALAVALALGGCTSAPSERTPRTTPSSSWEKGAGAPEAAAFMKVRIPEGATEVEGAVRVQPQEKVYLLSFVTSERTAKTITEDLHPDHPLAVEGPSSSSLSGDGYRHLGLTPPQELKSVRTTSACPPCTGDSRRRHVQGIEIHVGEVPGDRVRVYLTAY